jgi:hypothetical protein
MVRPRTTLIRLEKEKDASLQGILALLLVIAVYTLILLIYILRGYPAAAHSMLPLALADQYKFQVWYQEPLFFVATVMVAALLVLISRANRRSVRFGVVFARISFATVVPFACTSMLIELGLALLLATGVLDPKATGSWLSSAGSWFAITYQLVALVWLFALLALTVKITIQAKWRASLPLALLLLVVYGLPIGLFIR